jgi:hypothetical protein
MAGAEMGAAIELGIDRLDHARIVVTEEERTVAAEIVDIAIAVDVPFQRAAGARDIERIGIEVAAIVREPAGQPGARSLRQRRRARGERLVGGGEREVRQGCDGHDNFPDIKMAVSFSGPVAGRSIGADARESLLLNDAALPS